MKHLVAYQPKASKTRDQRAITHYENEMRLALQKVLELLNPEDILTWRGYTYREILPYAHDFLTAERRAVESPESEQESQVEPAKQTALEL